MKPLTLATPVKLPILSDNIQHKLLLLFVFDKMEMAMTEETVMDFCSSTNTWVNYMDCRIALSELIENSLIAPVASSGDNRSLFDITPEGRVCLAHFFPRVPTSVREDVSKKAKEQRMVFKRKQEYFADYIDEKRGDGAYKVVLRIAQQAQPEIEIALNVQNRQTAENMCKNWREKAPNVYQSIYDILVE